MVYENILSSNNSTPYPIGAQIPEEIMTLKIFDTVYLTHSGYPVVDLETLQ